MTGDVSTTGVPRPRRSIDGWRLVSRVAAVAFLTVGAVIGFRRWRVVAVIVVAVGLVTVILAWKMRRWRRSVPFDAVIGFALAMVMPARVALHNPGYTGGYRQCILDPALDVGRIEVVKPGQPCGDGNATEPAAGDYEVVKIGDRWYRYVPEAETDPSAATFDEPDELLFDRHLYEAVAAAVLLIGGLAVRQLRRRRPPASPAPTPWAPPTPPTAMSPTPPAHTTPTEAGDGWSEPEWAVMVRLVGEPDVIGRTQAAPWVELERSNVRRARAVEILAWAVTHRGHSRDALVDAVWQGAASRSTINNNLSAARRVCVELGGPGVDWLPVTANRLQPDTRLICDLDLIDAVLTLNRTATDAAAARRVLEHAASLIGPTPASAATTWRWFDLDGIEQRARGTVIDLSLALAARCVELGDAQAAVDATDLGLHVDPAGDEIVMARLRAQALTGAWQHFDDTHRLYIRRCRHLDREPADDVTALARELRKARP